MRVRRGDGAAVDDAGIEQQKIVDLSGAEFGRGAQLAAVCREIRRYVPPGLPFLDS